MFLTFLLDNIDRAFFGFGEDFSDVFADDTQTE